MTPSDLLQDQFTRILDKATGVVDGMSDQDLRWRPDRGSNSVAWLLWHVGRIQDDHVADVAGTSQAWTDGEWARRFGLPEGSMDTGFGYRPDQVAALQPDDAEVVVDYLSSVTERTIAFLDDLADDDLDLVVDDSWDPPVTLGVRLNSVVGDNWQHVGQAAHLRGRRERVS